MVVLGICGGHDANWCVFKDGKLVGHLKKNAFLELGMTKDMSWILLMKRSRS